MTAAERVWDECTRLSEAHRDQPLWTDCRGKLRHRTLRLDEVVTTIGPLYRVEDSAEPPWDTTTP